MRPSFGRVSTAIQEVSRPLMSSSFMSARMAAQTVTPWTVKLPLWTLSRPGPDSSRPASHSQGSVRSGRPCSQKLKQVFALHTTWDSRISAGCHHQSGEGIDEVHDLVAGLAGAGTGIPRYSGLRFWPRNREFPRSLQEARSFRGSSVAPWRVGP